MFEGIFFFIFIGALISAIIGMLLGGSVNKDGSGFDRNRSTGISLEFGAEGRT